MQPIANLMNCEKKNKKFGHNAYTQTPSEGQVHIDVNADVR